MRLFIRSTFALITVAVATVAVAACGSSGDGRANAAAPPTSGAAGATAASDAALAAAGAMPPDSTAIRTAADLGRIAGSPNAKVWMIIASDFQCPYCKMWHDQSYEAIKREYVDAGRLRMAYLHFPLEQHAHALPAAEATMCASAQGKFWDYQSAVFRELPKWGPEGDQSARYDSLATAHGLDLAKFRACTRSHVMRALIAADHDRMVQRGVASTPSFFIGNQKVEGAQPIEVFRQVIDAAIAQAR